MRFSKHLLAVVAAALSTDYHAGVRQVAAQAGANSTIPTNGTLVPIRVACPKERDEWIRPASRGLSPQELEWTKERKKVVYEALGRWLTPLTMDLGEDFKMAEYLEDIWWEDKNIPTIGLAISGGGWASAITGIGALRAFDERLEAAVQAHTGGILQSLTYISGLSGGSWPVVSLAVQDFPTIDDLIASWHTNISRLENVTSDTRYARTPDTMFGQVADKAEAGFNVSVAEFLGQAFAWEAAPGTDGGTDFTFSEIRNRSNFLSWNMPLPILQSVGLDADDPEYWGLQAPKFDSINWEYTPFEFGTFEGRRGGFIPMEYLGTTFDNGHPVDKNNCVRNFDKIAYVTGAASNAFNFWYMALASNGTSGQFSKRDVDKIHPIHVHGRRRPWYTGPAHKKGPKGPWFPVSGSSFGSSLKGVLGRGLSLLSKRTPKFNNFIVELVSAYTMYFNLSLPGLAYTTAPNPFKGTNFTQSTLWGPDALVTVDGSETLNALPIAVLARPERHADLIIAWDDAEDTPLQWMNGTDLYASYRQAKAARIPFPIVPQPHTFLMRNFTRRPVFFGCNANLTTIPKRGQESPIVLYLANSPYSAFTNYSDFQTALSEGQTREVMVNSFDLVTQANGTLAQEWPACLACAVTERSRFRTGKGRARMCEACFHKWCWDGTEEEAPREGIDSPLVADFPMRLHPEELWSVWKTTHDF